MTQKKQLLAPLFAVSILSASAARADTDGVVTIWLASGQHGAPCSQPASCAIDQGYGCIGGFCTRVGEYGEACRPPGHPYGEGCAPMLACNASNVCVTQQEVGLRGRTDCGPDYSTCNRCVNRVPESFAALPTAPGRNRFVTYLDGIQLYPSLQSSPASFGTLPTSHFQGMTALDFVDVDFYDPWGPVYGYSAPYYFPSPLNSSGRWYAHSFGEAAPNGISLAWIASSYFPTTPDAQRRNSHLGFYFKPPSGTHVGGIHSVGKYILAAVDAQGPATHVVVLDTSKPLYALTWNQMGKIPLGSLGVTRASSVGAVQLYDGSYAVIIQERSLTDPWQPWRDELREHDWSVVRVPSLDEPTVGVQVLSRVKKVPMSAADNIGAVVECETGRVFAVGASGPDSGSNNYWSLMLLHNDGGVIDGSTGEVQAPGAPILSKIASGRSPGASNICQGRAAATAFANETGGLVVACHEKLPQDADPQGSGIAKWWDWREFTPAVR